MVREDGGVPVEIGRLLDELQLRAFVFTVEPKEGQWVLQVECATDGAWQTFTLALDESRLPTMLRDPLQRERFKADLNERLRACARGAG